MKNEIKNLPWYVKSFYNKDKNCYFLKVNKWWAVWSLFKYYLFMQWIKKNTYPYNWYILTNDIEISNRDYWVIPTNEDLKDLMKTN